MLRKNEKKKNMVYKISIKGKKWKKWEQKKYKKQKKKKEKKKNKKKKRKKSKLKTQTKKIKKKKKKKERKRKYRGSRRNRKEKKRKGGEEGAAQYPKRNWLNYLSNKWVAHSRNRFDWTTHETCHSQLEGFFFNAQNQKTMNKT